jgi:tartrate dehydratase alpha subunit/fumarate hydratase class I-like protein
MKMATCKARISETKAKLHESSEERKSVEELQKRVGEYTARLEKLKVEVMSKKAEKKKNAVLEKKFSTDVNKIGLKLKEMTSTMALMDVDLKKKIREIASLARNTDMYTSRLKALNLEPLRK